MSTISAAAVAALRKRTGVSILACKSALEEADGNEELAIEILRKKGIANAVKKADREQSEGAIFVADDGVKAAVVVLKCETDFVARNEGFIALGEELAKTLHKEGLDAGKAAADIRLPEATLKLGENISIGEMQEIAAPVLAAYVHSNRKVAVIIGSAKTDVGAEKLKDVAMHATALNPSYVSPDEVPAEAIAKEREIWKEQLSKENKPAEIMEKIMTGKEKKFREENALLKQAFVKDPTQTVEQYLGGAGVTAYVRITV
jgi:elongation factor Ts